MDMLLFLSRRLQVVAATLLTLLAVQLAAAPPSGAPGEVRGTLAQIAPDRS